MDFLYVEDGASMYIWFSEVNHGDIHLNCNGKSSIKK